MEQDDRMTVALIECNVEPWGPGTEEELTNSHTPSIALPEWLTAHSNSLSTVTML